MDFELVLELVLAFVLSLSLLDSSGAYFMCERSEGEKTSVKMEM